MRRDSSAAGAVCSSASCPSATSSCASSIARGILLAPPQDWKDGRKYKQGQAQGVFAASGHGASSGSIPSVGTVLQPGNFRLHSLLGKGGFGKVYSAVVLSQPHSAAATSTKSMHVAVKVARTQGTKCEEALKMLRKKVRDTEFSRNQRPSAPALSVCLLWADVDTRTFLQALYLNPRVGVWPCLLQASNQGMWPSPITPPSPSRSLLD